MTLHLYGWGHSLLYPEPLEVDAGPLLSVARSGVHKRLIVGAGLPASPQPIQSGHGTVPPIPGTSRVVEGRGAPWDADPARGHTAFCLDLGPYGT